MVVYFKINRNKVFFLGLDDLVSLMIMGFFFLFKGVTTPFKPIYKRCGSQHGFVFHYFLRVPSIVKSN
jgi:hypothetical protein